MHDFSMSLTFFELKIANFRSPAGASLGSEGSRGVLRGKSTREGLDFLPKTAGTPKFPKEFPEICTMANVTVSSGNESFLMS